VPTNPLLLPSKGTQWGCLNCEWKLTARGYENYVPLSTHENPEAYFVWSYNSPNDLNGSVFTLTVVNPNNGVVVVKPFALSRGVDRLFWGDGGDVDIGAGVTKTVGCNISLPAWSVDGYDPARIVRIGLAMKPQDGSIGESGTATVIIRSWHFDPME
jgi:hypothetical protein